MLESFAIGFIVRQVTKLSPMGRQFLETCREMRAGVRVILVGSGKKRKEKHRNSQDLWLISDLINVFGCMADLKSTVFLRKTQLAQNTLNL
ncbi:hypothetical protein IJ00_17600 [Calothrix sp. 336/3]|uniref:hypothetical protein n=1 Tax=Calothrix sp. 336/3 TaxID=1337936 RepID=UPI00055662C6|nr:hypothetical protein [Calothrix sp. 336/3]AKG22847.1 hypothetical protein IJ00_17600 [Calothrix sp. 336/3]